VDTSASGGMSAAPPAAAKAESPAAPPESVGPYRIVMRLGQGGMGDVFLAEQTEPVRRRVAIKLIRAEMATHEIVARFQAEQQVLGLMNHPHIAGEYEAGTTPSGCPYFVMEYVPGAPITEFCDRERLGVEARLDLFMPVCDAIQHAHHKGIIHRDIKPTNVLVAVLDGKPCPKVIDFGIAKALGDDGRDAVMQTRAGALIGTPEFMSPEQAEGSNRDIDTRTDIYSLGVLLYHVLVGALPFETEELQRNGILEFRRAILEREPTKPSTRLGELGGPALEKVERCRNADVRGLMRRLRGDLDWIILKCLEKDRNRRYSAVSDLTGDIRRHLQHEPVLAGPPSVVYRMQKLCRRHRAPLLVAAGFCVLLAAAAAVAGHLSRLRFHGYLATVQESVANEDIESARKMLGLLEGAYKHRPEVVAAAHEVGELERRLRIRASARLKVEGDAHWKRSIELRASKEALDAAWKEAAREAEPWQPVWERERELAAWHRLANIDEEISAAHNQAVFALFRAMEEAPPASAQLGDVQSALFEVYWDRYQEAWRSGTVSLPPSYFKGMIDSLGLGARRKELSESVTVASDPPGAEVYCFRYENREERLLPLPFRPDLGREDPQKGIAGEPFLEVEAVWDDGGSPFRAGDRLLTVRGAEVKLHGDLARALAGVKSGERIEVQVRRAGETRTLRWTPFLAEREGASPASPEQPGRVIEPYTQFGVTFAGYPLDLRDDCRLGATKTGEPLRLELPRGSYLLVLRRDGYADARLPLAVPSVETKLRVQLLKESEIPPGFVYVPAGRFACGGDKDAYNGIEERTVEPGGFFLSRLELTVAEYIEFVNDPLVFARIDAQGEAEPECDWSSPELRPFIDPERRQGKVRLVPASQEGQFFEKRGGRWQAKAPGDWPLFSVSMLAGLEYAEWLTRKHQGRWRFRLPRDLEWEKAARGADRRPFVWGDYLLWSYFRSQKGSYPTRPTRKVDRGGIHPFDESVWGIRDLAGSLQEPVFERDSEFRLAVFRGGEWLTVDHRDFRAATRNRRRPEVAANHVGLRFAADLPR
jgi:serine/threonine protein kinase/formylglycine-generating enzyme required for sulfatase activity